MRSRTLAPPLLLLALLAPARPGAADAASSESASGDLPPAPAFELATVVQGPASVSLEALRGKAVVLEFWATWCAPCVASIPHMNELVEELGDEPVVFLSVSDEPEETVRPFLDRYPIDGWVALDRDRDVFAAYEIGSIPHAVLIDPRGRLRLRVYPQSLHAAGLRQLAAGETPDFEPLDLDRDRELAVRIDPAGHPESLYEVSIRPSTREISGMEIGAGRYVAVGLPLDQHLASAWDAPSTRLLVETDLPGQHYDVVVQVPNLEDVPFEPLRQALAATFALTVERETRDLEVRVLTATPGAAERLRPSGAPLSTGTARPGLLRRLGATLKDLAGTLESRLAVPVVDGTGIAGAYDFELTWNPARRRDLEKALSEQAGLELVPATRPLEVWVVRRRADRLAAPSPATGSGNDGGS